MNTLKGFPLERATTAFARWTSSCLGRESVFVQRLRPIYERILHSLAGGAGIVYRINGVPFRVSPFHRQLLAHDYDASVAEFLRDRIRPGDLCFDVGANIGVYALQLANWSGTEGKVIAFEPNPAARAVLERHVSWNKLDHRIQIEPIAVGSIAGEGATFFAAGADGKGRLSAPNPEIAKTASVLHVQVTTLTNYCEEYCLEPDWIILDVEGFEINVLIGLEQYLARSQRPVQLIIEMHPDLWASAGTSLEMAREIFAGLGLKPQPLSQQDDMWLDHGSVFAQAGPS